MKMTNKDICIALERLRQKDFTDFETFYEFLGTLCEKYLNSQAAKGYKALMNKDDLRNSFYEILVTKNTLGWKSKSHLCREIGRLYISKASPASRKFWLVISRAINILIKEGECEKAEEYQDQNNKNTTVVYAKNCSGNRFDLKLFEERCKSVDEFAKLPPKNARELVYQILNAAEAPITIGKIIEVAFHKTPVYQETGPLKENEDGKTYETVNKTIDEQFQKERSTLESFGVRVEQEAENRAQMIWNEIDTMAVGRGDKVPGNKILCLYYLPKNILGSKVTLESLGKVQTIQDATVRIAKIMHRYMDDDAFNDLAKLQVFKKLLKDLFRFCSENGLGENLDMVEVN